MNQYSKKLDTNTRKLYIEYCQKNGHSSFQNQKTGFENYIMNLESSTLSHITSNQTLYRDYRAYMREHYNRLEEPWPVALAGFKSAYLMKPERYRNFVVIGPEAKQRVIKFYDWVDEQINANSSTVFSEIKDEELVEMEKKAYKLYCQKDMWRNIKKGKSVGNWLNELKDFLVQIIRKQLAKQSSLSNLDEKRNNYVYEINRVLIKFHKCFHTKEFIFGTYERFLKTCIRKCLELAFIDGVPESIYLLAKIRPDMISSDCYPWINTKTDMYKKTDYTRLNNVKEYRRLEWCQEYMKPERHSVV